MSIIEKEILSLLKRLDRDALIRIAYAALNVAEGELYISPEQKEQVLKTANQIDSGELDTINISEFKSRLNKRIEAAKNARKGN